MLATLETNAQVAILALGDAHPDIQDDADPDPDALKLHAAIAILGAARRLSETINRYRVPGGDRLAEQRDDWSASSRAVDGREKAPAGAKTPAAPRVTDQVSERG